MVESFRVGLEKGLQAAAELKADGVQIFATAGEMHPANMNSKRRADLRKHIAGLGLEISALCGDFGGHGFQDAIENSKKIEETKMVIDLALDLGCRVVTTHIGLIPSAANHPRYAVMARACEAIGRCAAEKKAVLAIETGPEPALVLGGFLDAIGLTGGLGVNFDPANLVMVCREDIPRAVKILGKYIVHTHAKDGLNFKPFDPERLYGLTAGESPDFNYREYFKEVPLGQGQVPFPAYWQALKEARYDGYLTIEREVGATPMADIAEAVTFLRSLLKRG
jgi:sugar phosphate isomerase/epimerase